MQRRHLIIASTLILYLAAQDQLRASRPATLEEERRLKLDIAAIQATTIRAVPWSGTPRVAPPATSFHTNWPTKIGMSFRDYYRDHKDEIDYEIQKKQALTLAGGDLHGGVWLTDVDGFDELKGLDNLRQLDLRNNQLTHVTITKALPLVEDINLTNNQLTEVPAFIYDSPRLINLRLGHNQITRIDSNIGLLSGLTILRLDHNQLSTIPETIGDLRNLRVLRLNNNRLTAIPDTIGKLDGLFLLRLDNNMLTSIPATIIKLAVPSGDLSGLELYNNPIPLTQEQLRKKLMLTDSKFTLSFKSPQQERAEHALFKAIKEGDVKTVQFRFTYIRIGAVRGPLDPEYNIFTTIDPAKIRDEKGNNLMHATVQAAAAQIQPIQKHVTAITSDANLTPAEKKAQIARLERDLDTVNDRYMKIFGILLSCGDECVNSMLFTPNASGLQVIDAIFAKLGPESSLFKAILEGIPSEEEEEEKTITWHE